MSISKTTLSIIIVVKNDRGISDTLDHLQRSRTNVAHEVIVVDASEPHVLADIRASHAWVRWCQFPPSHQRSTPQQRNRGLELATGDLIAFIDANCIPSPDWLDAIARRLAQGEDIVCGPVLDAGADNLVHYAPSIATGTYVDVCTTISVGFTRQVVNRIGGFDPSFRFGQDIDFFWRATEAGFKIYYDPQVVISHEWGSRKEQLRRAFDYGKARAHLYKKHWRFRKGELLRETHVWIYPVFILGLPLTYFVPVYPLLILVPAAKHWSSNPFGLIAHHLVYGCGVLSGALKSWRRSPHAAIAL